jgi:hypothetical protein
VFCSHGNRQPTRSDAAAYDPERVRVRTAWINGLAGFVITYAAGTPIQTVAIEPNAEGRIAVVYVQRNPEKLLNLRHAGEKKCGRNSRSSRQRRRRFFSSRHRLPPATRRGLQP